MVSLCLHQGSSKENLTNVGDLVLGGNVKGVSHSSGGRNGWSNIKAMVWGILQSKHASLPTTPCALHSEPGHIEFYFCIGGKGRGAGMALP